MKKILIASGLTLILSVSSVSADALKNSLNNLMNEKDTTGMVNLNAMNINGKAKPKAVQQVKRKSRPGSAIIGRYNDKKPVFKKEADAYIKKVTKGKIKDIDLLPRKQRLIVLKDLQNMYKMKHFKSRPSTAIVATVNGVDVIKKEADSYLKRVTAGKVTDFDRLEKKQRQVLIEDLARPMVLKDAVENNITEEEKEAVYKQMWLEKQRATIEVTSEEMLALYELKKEKTLATNPQAQIPHYMSLGDSLKNEIFEKKMMVMLMKDVNISINYENNITTDTNESSETLGKIQHTKETE